MDHCPEPILLIILGSSSLSTLRSCLRLNKTFRKCVFSIANSRSLKPKPFPNYKALAKITCCAMCKKKSDKVLCKTCKNGMVYVNSGVGFKSYTKTWHYERFSGRILSDDYYTISLSRNEYTFKKSYTDTMWDSCRNIIRFEKDGMSWKLVEAVYKSDDHNYPGNITEFKLSGLQLSLLLRIVWKGPFILKNVFE